MGSRDHRAFTSHAQVSRLPAPLLFLLPRAPHSAQGATRGCRHALGSSTLTALQCKLSMPAPSAVQKHFIKLLLRGEEVPPKVAETGRGYTLSGVQDWREQVLPVLPLAAADTLRAPRWRLCQIAPRSALTAISAQQCRRGCGQGAALAYTTSGKNCSAAASSHGFPGLRYQCERSDYYEVIMSAMQARRWTPTQRQRVLMASSPICLPVSGANWRSRHVCMHAKKYQRGVLASRAM